MQVLQLLAKLVAHDLSGTQSGDMGNPPSQNATDQETKVEYWVCVRRGSVVEVEDWVTALEPALEQVQELARESRKLPQMLHLLSTFGFSAAMHGAYTLKVSCLREMSMSNSLLAKRMRHSSLRGL